VFVRQKRGMIKEFVISVGKNGLINTKMARNKKLRIRLIDTGGGKEQLSQECNILKKKLKGVRQINKWGIMVVDEAMGVDEQKRTYKELVIKGDKLIITVIHRWLVMPQVVETWQDKGVQQGVKFEVVD
jgi:predicted GTPase